VKLPTTGLLARNNFRVARDPTRKRLGERWSLKRMIEKQLDVFLS
jgi:hypothetical protein